MKEVLALIERFLNGQIAAWEFSFELEDALIGHYAEMMKENPLVTEILNENLPEICAECEGPDTDSEVIRRKVKAEYQRAIAASQ